ncbi:MAG: ankyrin repeat domain-containing protein [Gemmatimonadota bacterium]|nr:ankyrin repeat domain-containing protein [Gemmatimonadota bacterium]MDE2984869.1 ankyrin repeat domain-containing protein [Gemmatimonadota bacterium]
MRPFGIAATLLVALFATACAGGRGTDSKGANSPAAATPGAAAAPTPSTSEPTPPTCDDWRNRNFFASASLELVRECLEAGADPQAPVTSAPAIFSAARTATDPGIITLLTDAGADPNTRLGGGLRGTGSAGSTPLHTAAAQNSTPGIVNALVAAGAAVDARDSEGRTPLHAAWTNGRAVIQALRRLGADPLARDERGRVADPVSCANWNTAAFSRLALLSEFKLCLELGEGLNARDSDGNTPLHLAAETVNPSAVRFLLEEGADLNAPNNLGATPLHIAVNNEGVQFLVMVREEGADIGFPSSITPLHIPEGNEGEEILPGLLDAGADIMTALLEAGADVNAGSGTYGTPLLHVITGSRRVRTAAINEAAVAALLEAGADVNAADSDGNIPLLASLNTERREAPLSALALRLLALGADPNRRDGRGRTPLFEAAALEEPTVIHALLEAGADPLALTDDGASTLHAAAASGSPDVVNLLVGAGVDPNALMGDFGTPLHIAVGGSSGGLFARTVDSHWRLRAFALLEGGADPNARAKQGDTPLHRTSDTVLVTGLVRAGADVNARNDMGETPLHLARRRNRLPAIRRLLEFGADPEARDHAGRIADPDCHWELRGSPLHGAAFLANAPVESVRGCLESGMSADARGENGATLLENMVSALACCADFENVLREVVAAGADVNAWDDEGRTLLHRALTMSGRVPASVLNVVASALLEAGADPNARDLQGRTPFHTVAGTGDSSFLVDILAAAGADINARDNSGQTPLHIALGGYDPATVRALWRAGADTAARDSAGTTADPVACERWGTRNFFAVATADIVADCIAAGADVHTAVGRYSRVAVPLAKAAEWTRDPAVISVLLEAGADVHARDDFYQYTPLHHAARKGTEAMVRALLEAGADADAWATGYNTDFGWNWTPLHLAAENNPDPGVVAALLEAGADFEALGGAAFRPPANSPLHYAGANSNPAVAEVLLDAGADVNARSPSGRTPLHEAAAYASNPAVIELLVAAGADVNARDLNGHAPMHSAAWYNHRPEVMAALIAAGADLNARDPDGYEPPAGGSVNDRTPLLMTVYRGGGYIGGGPTYTKFNAPVVETLVRAGADLTLTDESGRTALHEAARWHPAVFPLLMRLGADPTVRDAEGTTPLDYALRNRSLEGLPEVRRMREALRRR